MFVISSWSYGRRSPHLRCVFERRLRSTGKLEQPVERRFRRASLFFQGNRLFSLCGGRGTGAACYIAVFVEMRSPTDTVEADEHGISRVSGQLRALRSRAIRRLLIVPPIPGRMLVVRPTALGEPMGSGSATNTWLYNTTSTPSGRAERARDLGEAGAPPERGGRVCRCLRHG